MKCPVDDTELTMTDRQGIEIDYCPKCRGVWLDRGELDKLIERTAISQNDGARSNTYDQPTYHEPQQRRPSHDEHYDERQYGKKRKKEGFLGDLFDF
ncbi:MAG: hypothetical protein JWM37_925 [Candidatus Saccharibacteria bacterium]|nr:hypothetical protein [Candidatus Saccharibacteria bacterium]